MLSRILRVKACYLDRTLGNQRETLGTNVITKSATRNMARNGTACFAMRDKSFLYSLFRLAQW